MKCRGDLRCQLVSCVIHHLTNVPQPARTDLYLLRHALGYDLAVAPDSVSVEPMNPPPGNAAIVKAKLENRGDMAVQNAEIAFYEGDPNSGGVLIGTAVIPDLLTGGSSREISVEWSIPLSVSSGELHVVVDPALVLDDRDRSNNSASALGQYLDRVRAGEEVVVTDSGEPVTKLVPLTQVAGFKARYEELVRAGRIRPPLEPPTREWVEAFLRQPMVKDPDGSVLKAVLEERESGW